MQIEINNSEITLNIYITEGMNSRITISDKNGDEEEIDEVAGYIDNWE